MWYIVFFPKLLYDNFRKTISCEELYMNDSTPEPAAAAPRPLRRLFDNRLFQYLLLPAVLIYYEVLMRLFTPTPLFPHLIFPVLFAAALGFFLSAILSLIPPRARWWITNVIMAVLAFYSGLEAVLRGTYQMYMNLSSILGELGHVAGNYGSDVANGFRGAIPLLIAYYIPLILRFVLRKTYAPRRDCPAGLSASMLGCWLGLWGLGILLAMNLPAVSDHFAAQYEFDGATQTFGLFESTALDTQYALSGNPAAESFTLEESENPTNPEDDTEADAYHVMDIDFDALIEEADSEAIQTIHEYVRDLTPSAKNEYTGLFAGKNLITICAESFSLQVIDEELTPTLYRLATKGIQFTDFYQPSWGGSTSTGEYSLLTGLVPTNSTDSMRDTIGDNMYFTTGNQLQRLGYTSLAFHNGSYDYYERDKTHTNLGYDQFLAWGNGMENLLPAWSEDEDTFRATLETYINDPPFNAYYMTISGHCPYTADYPLTEQNIDRVRDVLGDEYEDTTLYYFCYQLELEDALTTMVDMLEEAGIADDTVIVLCADHYPYGLAKSTTFGNRKDYLPDLYQVDTYDRFVRDQNALIIWSGSIEDMGLTVDTPTYSLDILPTLSNLFGLEYDSRLLVGRDVFSDEEPLCIWTDHSFLTEKGYYDASTGEFVPTTDEEVTDAYLEEMRTTVANKIAFSAAVPRYDYYGILFGTDDKD